MRPLFLVSLCVLPTLTLSSLALAQTTTTTSTAAALPAPQVSTVSTTQASIDTTPTVVPPASPTEVSGTTHTTFVNRPLLGTGLVLLGGSYAASAIIGAESSRPSDQPNLYYPIVGPWLDLAQRDCTASRPCSGETGNKTLLILDGVGQGLGALAVLTSFFIPEKAGRHYLFIGNSSVHAEPVAMGYGGYGLAALGRF